MKVIIASTVVPFIEGGGTFIVDWLAEMVQAQGHTVEVLKMPFSSYYPEMLDQMLALRLMDLSQHGDRLIAIRSPSYLLRHPHKVLWFIAHHRGAYDLWGTMYQDIPNTSDGLRYRDAIMRADNAAFREATRIFSLSRVVAGRLKRFNNVDAEVLYPPLMQPERYHTGAFGDYIFFPSRLTHHKRQWLAIEGLRHTKTAVKLLIAGKPDSENEPYPGALLSLAQRYGLEDRVSIVSRWISEQEKIQWFAGCLATIHLPLDEDAYGYPTLEAHYAGKAVITVADAGGVRELIADGENGFVTAPEPEAIGEAMDRLYLDRALAQRMGGAGRGRIAQLGISWQNVLQKLLQ